MLHNVQPSSFRRGGCQRSTGVPAQYWGASSVLGCQLRFRVHTIGWLPIVHAPTTHHPAILLQCQLMAFAAKPPGRGCEIKTTQACVHGEMPNTPTFWAQSHTIPQEVKLIVNALSFWLGPSETPALKTHFGGGGGALVRTRFLTPPSKAQKSGFQGGGGFWGGPDLKLIGGCVYWTK